MSFLYSTNIFIGSIIFLIASQSIAAIPDCKKKKCIALTFDDGPAPPTRKLLDILDKSGIKATFFVTGAGVKSHPDILKRAAAAGHEIGNHSWSHPDLRRAGQAEFRRQISLTQKIIRETAGIEPKLLRPPYGAIRPRNIRDAGLAVIIWSLDTWDWKRRNTENAYQTVVKKARAGDIVLMHDTRLTSVLAVTRIIDMLKSKGFVFITVSQLLGNPAKGKIYFRQTE